MTSIGRRAFLKTSGAAGVTTLTALAGCSGGGDGGGDGGDGGGDGGDGGSIGSGSGPGPVTIVSTIPKTGAFSSIAQDLQRGYEMGVKRMDDNDVLGRGAELFIEDDETDPNKVREKLTGLISDHDVDLILSSFADLLIGNQVQIAEREGIPLIAIAQSNTKLHTDNETNWLYSPFPQTRDHVEATRAVLDSIPEADRPSKAALWVPNEDWSTRMADGWEEQLSDGGYEVVLREKHQIAASDFSTLISKSESAGADILLSTATPGGGITAMKQIRDSDFSPRFVEVIRAADTKSWFTALGEGGLYTCMSPGWVPGLTGNGNEEMVQTYHDTYDVPADSTLPVMVGATYNSTQTAEQALEAAGTADKAEVQAALRSETFNTVSGSGFTFDDRGVPENWTAAMGQWIDGNQHLVYPETDGQEYRDLVYPWE